MRRRKRKQMKPEPKISVVMPVHNGAPFITEAVNSILNQTFTDFELIIVDDGSTDSTRIITASLERKDTRVRVFRTEAKGVVKASNFGIEKAKGRWIARLDADDIALNDRLLKQLEYAENNNLDLIGSKAEIISDDDIGDGFKAYFAWTNGLLSHEEIQKEILSESPFIHSSIFAKKEIFRKFPYKLENGPEDYELWLRMSRNKVKFGKVDETLVKWRYNKNGNSRSATTDTKIFAKVKLEHLLKCGLQEKRKIVIQGAGHQGKMWLRLLLEHNLNVVGLLDVAEKRIGKKIENVQVFHLDEINRLKFDYLISAVGQKGPNTKRDEIRQQLKTAGLTEQTDFAVVC